MGHSPSFSAQVRPTAEPGQVGRTWGTRPWRGNDVRQTPILKGHLLGHGFSVGSRIGGAVVNRRRVVGLNGVASAHALEVARPYFYVVALASSPRDHVRGST